MHSQSSYASDDFEPENTTLEDGPRLVNSNSGRSPSPHHGLSSAPTAAGLLRLRSGLGSHATADQLPLIDEENVSEIESQSIGSSAHGGREARDRKGSEVRPMHHHHRGTGSGGGGGGGSDRGGGGGSSSNDSSLMEEELAVKGAFTEAPARIPTR